MDEAKTMETAKLHPSKFRPIQYYIVSHFHTSDQREKPVYKCHHTGKCAI